MKLLYDCFLRPYWMELLGLCFLTLSIFVAGQLVVDLGFSLLIAGTVVNGGSHIQEKYQDWRREKDADRNGG